MCLVIQQVVTYSNIIEKAKDSQTITSKELVKPPFLFVQPSLLLVFSCIGKVNTYMP